MPESTVQRLLCLLLCISLPLIGSSTSARMDDGRATIAIAPLSHEIPNVGRGVRGMLAFELRRGGRFHVIELEEGQVLAPGEADYLLSGAVSYLGINERQGKNDMAGELSDLGYLMGNGERAAQALLDITVADLGSGNSLGSFLLEGLESRRGEMPARLSAGWLGALDFQGDELRRSAIGRALYKASGALLGELYRLIPLQGTLIGIDEGLAVVDLGEDSGICVGELLDVYRPQGIYSQAGEQVWDGAWRTGCLEVLELRSGRCLCRIAEGADIIEEGDTVLPLLEREYYPMEADRD